MADQSLDVAAAQIHSEWMKRNPKSDWNAAQHVPYEQLPEEEKEKDRAHARLVQQLVLEHPRKEDEAETDFRTRIADVFGSHAHEEWRSGHEASKGVGATRMKDVTTGPEQVNINVAWSELHPEWKAENLAAGHAAVAAVLR